MIMSFPVTNDVNHWIHQTWQYYKSEPHTKPCLMVCAVQFHQCKNVSDGISKTRNGSKKKHEGTVPLEFVHIPPDIEPDCICYSSVYSLTTIRISLKSEFYGILEFETGEMSRQSKHTISQPIFPGLKRSSVTTVGMISNEPKQRTITKRQKSTRGRGHTELPRLVRNCVGSPKVPIVRS